MSMEKRKSEYRQEIRVGIILISIMLAIATVLLESFGLEDIGRFVWRGGAIYIGLAVAGYLIAQKS